MPGFPVLQYLPEFVQTHVCLESMMLSNHLILCHPFSPCPQFFPAPGSFLMAQFFASGGQGIGALASASLLPMNIQGWFPLGLTCLNSLLSSSVPFSHSVMSDYLWLHGWAGKESACNSWDLGSIPGLGRSPGKRKGYPFPYSALVNSMDNIPWATCCPRDFQKSSPAPQFENISSSGLSLLYGTTFHPYMTTGKHIVLTRWTFVSKLMSLFLNLLSRFLIAFLLRSKCLWISCLTHSLQWF